MDKPKDTASAAEKQPPNGYGRIPDELFGPLCQLSHLDRSVFLLLCIKANRYRARRGKPVGEVPNSVNDVAMWLGTSRGSVRRALKSLDRVRLIDYWRGGIRVRHYVDKMDHGDPDMDHGDPLLDHGDPPPGSPRSTQTPQLKLNIDTYEPYKGSEEVSNVVDVAASTNGGKKGRKAPVRKKRVKPWIRWDSEANAVVVDEGDDRAKKFTEKWIGLLGSSDRVYDEFFKFSKWMKDDLRRPQRTKNFAGAFGNWLEKEISE